MTFSGLSFKNQWCLTEERYALENEATVAALFTVGNGYMGVRGSLEEYGSLCIQGSYIRGLIDEVNELPQPFLDNEYMKKHYFNEQELRRFQKQEKVINYADFLLVRVSVGGETFYPWEGELLSWERTLDMEHARLCRTVRWKNSKGQITRLCFERFASADNDHVFAQKVQIIPENYTDTIEILTGVDGLTKTNGQLVTERVEASAENGVTRYINRSGPKYGFSIATVTTNEIYADNEKIPCVWESTVDSELIAAKTVISVEREHAYTLEKEIFVACERDGEDPADFVERLFENRERYDTLYENHCRKWREVFDRINVEIDGDDTVDRTLRFNNYHTVISFDRNDSVHSLGAKGLTGEVYNNWVWWDCEAYQSPVFYYTMPNEAKNLLLYRYGKLDAARENARLEGRKGARFPFNSSVTGKEVVWKYCRHPFLQIHIVSDIGLAVNRYYDATGDDDFMISYGMEMLFEIVRYWASRVEYIHDRFEIRNVTGTDEHHPEVDNNAYTNYSVKTVIDRTLSFTEQYGEQLSELKKRLGVTENELAAWREVAQKLYLPIDKTTGLIPQFDGYFDLSRDLEVASGSSAKAFQMKASGMYHKSQVIKQPDVLMLFGHNNLKFNREIYARNWNYYIARCEASSSLSFSTHAICSADLGMIESAYDFLLKTLLIDLEDEHDCSWQGIHSACAAGAWLAGVRAIGGVELHPHMIGWWKSMKYSFFWHGQKLYATLTNEELTVISDPTNTETVPLLFEGKTKQLHVGETVSIGISI